MNDVALLTRWGLCSLPVFRMILETQINFSSAVVFNGLQSALGQKSK